MCWQEGKGRDEMWEKEARNLRRKIIRLQKRTRKGGCADKERK